MFVRFFEGLVKVEAPAKLNLFLEVLARRDDGFHEIETLITAISIFDTLSFYTEDEGPIRLTCRWASGLQSRHHSQSESTLGDVPTGVDNLVVRAVEQLRRRAGVKHGASIRLIKRIPSAAGLGGASSDAAAAMVAANHAWKLGLTQQQLESLAGELGSDIPCFFDSRAAVCRGRGERIEWLDRFAKLHVVVVRPPEGLGTADVYRHCQVPAKPRSVRTLLKASDTGEINLLAKNMMNRLQPAASSLSPWIDRLASMFDGMDCLGHQMSGSGSSYFGVCRHARHARRVSSLLRARGLGSVFCATTLASHDGRATSFT